MHIELPAEHLQTQSLGAKVCFQFLPAIFPSFQQYITHTSRHVFSLPLQPPIAIIQHQHGERLHIRKTIIGRNICHHRLHGIADATVRTRKGEPRRGAQTLSDGILQAVAIDAPRKGFRQDDRIGRMHGSLPRTRQHIHTEYLTETRIYFHT